MPLTHKPVTLRLVLGLLLVFLFSWNLSQAQTTDVNNQGFSVDQANKVYDQLALKLSTQDLNAAELNNAIAQLTQLREQAKYCVNNTQEQLTTINKQLQAIQNETSTKNTAHTYLTDKRTKIERRMNECRFFLLRANDAITAYQQALDRLTATRLFSQSPHIWQDIQSLPIYLHDLSYQTLASLWQNSGLNLLPLSGVSLLLIAIVVDVLITRYATILLNRMMEKLAITKRLTLVFLATLKHNLPYLLFPLIVALVLTLTNTGNRLNLLAYCAYGLLGYFTMMSVVQAFLYPPASTKALISITQSQSEGLTRRLRLLVALLTIGFIGYGLVRNLDLPIGLIRLAFVLLLFLLTVISINVISFSSAIVKARFPRNWVINTITIGLYGVLLANLVITSSGYFFLAYHLMTGIIETLIMFILAVVLTKVMGQLLQLLNGKTNRWQQKLRYYLGIKLHKNIVESYWLYGAGVVLIWSVFFVEMLLVWGLSSTQYNTLMDYLINGFTAGDLTIVPLQIFEAVVLFSLLGLASRWISTSLGHRSGLYAQRGDTQIELASITLYVGYSISLLIALLAAGVNFTGLAIIAGALSIGIGFGLQNIINNVVCGIILLLERPIRPGDRVIIGQTEGFVRRIRIRATQIMTMERSDVMIPNSEFIANQVINLMFRDQRWRVTCQVGVAYGSNTELVSNVLLRIAHDHPDVLDEPPDAPKVLFRAFGESSLEFELWCIVKDVNKKHNVLSELNFAIDQAFRQQGITIAFPQRDVHIKHDRPAGSSKEGINFP